MPASGRRVPGAGPRARSTTSWPGAGCRCWSAVPGSTSGRCWRSSSSRAPTRRSGPGWRRSWPRRPGRCTTAAGATRSPPQDPAVNGRRIVRALEVIELTGAVHRRLPSRRRTTIGADRRRPGHRRAGRADRARVDRCGRPGCSTRSAACPASARGPYGRPRARLPAGAGPARRGDDRGRRRRRRRSAAPAGSSAGSGPGSAATRAITWLDGGARPTLVADALAAAR